MLFGRLLSRLPLATDDLRLLQRLSDCYSGLSLAIGGRVRCHLRQPGELSLDLEAFNRIYFA